MGALHTCRVLIVDLDEAYARRLAEALLLSGHAATCTHGIDETLAAARRSSVDLALIDPAACGGLGLVLARQLRDALGIPFICLAGSGDADEAARAAELGALAFLVKPVEPAHCALTVGVALGVAQALAAERHGARESIASLERALGESRAIGFAVGLVMERMRMDRTRAFAALREEARARRQRIGEVAESLLGAAEMINTLQGQEPAAVQLLAS